MSKNILQKTDEAFVRYLGVSKAYERCVDKGCIGKKLGKTGKNISKKTVVELIEFLVEWKTRGVTSPQKKEGKNTVRALFKAINSKDAKNARINLSKSNFSSLDLQKHNDDIKILYKAIDKVRSLGNTATSKILHILFPDVFIMWDNSIRKKYWKKIGKSGGPNSYIKFLKLMQKRLKNWRPQRSSWTITIKRKPSIPKLIDEYNYLKYTKVWKI